MTKQKQTFHNATNAPIFLNLELSTARFRLDPDQELILHYDTEDRRNEHGSSLRVDLVKGEHGDTELVIWTAECEMFYPDGRTAPTDYGRDIRPLSS